LMGLMPDRGAQVKKRGRKRGPASTLTLVALLAIALFASCQKPPTYQVVAAREGYTHIISQGETLESIAEKYYGDGRLGEALGEYNDLDPMRPLAPGTTLLVPFDATALVKITRTNEGNIAYNRGTMLARTGQYEEAVPYLEKAVDADPANTDAWYNLGVAYEKLERPQDALPIFERLVWSHPSDRTYQYGLGSALRRLGRKDEALKVFKKAVDLDSEYLAARYALALTYEDLGRVKQARREWARYLELDPDSVWSEEARNHFEKLGGR
jgi:tetratricopeptide (TPR) repeat protein